jgi:hypothetical protein
VASYKDKEKEFEEAFNDAYDLWFPWMSEAHKDFKYYIEDPWTEADREYLRQQNREILNFNITRRIVKMITGYERRNRLALKIGPSEGSDDTVAGQLTGVVMPLMENNNGYEVVSDAFEMGSCVAGANLVEPYLDRHGNIQFARKPYNKFLLDPNFSRRDLKDCSYIIIHEEGMLTEDVKSLVPGKGNLISQYAKLEGGNEVLPYSAFKGRGREDGKRCNYSEFWERKTKKVKVVANRQNGQQFVWQQDQKQLDELLARHGYQLTTWDDWKETVRFSAFVNGRCVHKGPDPNKIDDYPHVLMAGFWYPEYDDYSTKLQGEVRPLRDPQREVSKRISKILDIIDSQVSTGMLAEENALVNPDDIHATGQGKGIWLKEGAMAKVQERQMGDIPQGLFQLNHDLQSLINDIGCVNDSMFGNDEISAQMSGYLMALRTGAGLVALQDLFDNRRFALKQLAFKLVKLVQKNYSPQKVFRIINEQPAPNFYSEDLAQYDCTPQEGILTETQQQTFYTELLNLKSLGFAIPEEVIIEAAPVQFKQKIKEAIIQAQRQQQAAQAEEMKEKQLIDQMRGAKIAADLGRAAERESQVEENRAGAALDRIKTAKEIEQFGYDRLMGLLDRVIAIETASRKEAKTRR